ncbi:MAG: type I DNA topoisomerase, partial [Lachnospiraceae bacterium]|nr:type I DNA topoisomerase [Lachnospiraceae bacterium]
VKGAKKPIVASFYGDKNGKMDISDKATLDEIMKACEKESFRVISSKKSKREKKKPLPFTTSTLQQEASKALNFSLQKTMQVAQQLYEGVDIKGSGTVGLITYLRTDSVRISEEAKADAKAFITETFGAEFSDDTDISTKKSKKNIQDAHEAIRPANLHLIPSEIKESLSRDQFRLYQLIWRRFMASQMSSAEYETTTVRVGAGDYVFSLATSKRIFDGFMSVYVSADDEEEDKNAVTESLNEESVLTLKEFQEKQHFTQPPAHFTEASLVHTLEELGIGRPSTYSPTITVLLKRRYIGKEGRSIFVTELGDVVNDIMKESFPTIVDESFTANMESLLDGVEEGDVDWKSIVRNFYPDLEESVKIAEEQLQKVEISDEVTDVICENCGRNMVIKYGPHGKFLACPGFPDCRNTKPYLEKIGVSCPKCGKDIVVRKTKKGRRFYGCEDYPECDFMSWPRPVADKCPKCGGYMVQKGNRIVCANEQCGYIAESKS